MAYAASKAGMVGLTQVLAVEHGAAGLRVNALLPGGVDTPMGRGFAPTPEALIIARLLSGVAAALLFPTTLSLISALYRGKARVSAIALWSGLGAGVAAIAPVLGGWMLIGNAVMRKMIAMRI